MTTRTVTTTIDAPLEVVRDYRNDDAHIIRRAFASDDWHCPTAENDLRVGGKLVITMAAKDGSTSFDFTATYTDVQEPNYLAYTIEDGRKVMVSFEEQEGMTLVTETFEAENVYPPELQQAGRQAILDNFKKYVEGT